MEKWEQGYYITAVAGEGGCMVLASCSVLKRAGWSCRCRWKKMGWDGMLVAPSCMASPLAGAAVHRLITGQFHVRVVLPGVYGTFWAAGVRHNIRAGEIECMFLLDAEKGTQEQQ